MIPDDWDDGCEALFPDHRTREEKRRDVERLGLPLEWFTDDDSMRVKLEHRDEFLDWLQGYIAGIGQED